MIWADTLRDRLGTAPSRRSRCSWATRPTDEAGVVARTAYTTAHQMTWKAKVSGYLVTKAVAAGVMLVAALLVLMGHADDQAAVGVVPPDGRRRRSSASPGSCWSRTSSSRAASTTCSPRATGRRGW